MDKRYMSDGMLDLLTLFGFIIGIENLDLNVSQNDLQEQTAVLDSKVDKKVQEALLEIHKHLELQDRKIDFIIEVLKSENH